jgi:hypothetical protein
MKQKTYKREVAFLMFVHLVYLTLAASEQMVALLVTPYIAFMAAVFLADAAGKQVNVFNSLNKPSN